MQKSQKKRRKKNFVRDVFLCGFSIFGDTKGGKSKWFCFFSVRGEEKCEINYKKEKIYFCPFWKLSCPFLVVCFRKR